MCDFLVNFQRVHFPFCHFKGCAIKRNCTFQECTFRHFSGCEIVAIFQGVHFPFFHFQLCVFLILSISAMWLSVISIVWFLFNFAECHIYFETLDDIFSVIFQGVNFLSYSRIYIFLFVNIQGVPFQLNTNSGFFFLSFSRRQFFCHFPGCELTILSFSRVWKFHCVILKCVEFPGCEYFWCWFFYNFPVWDFSAIFKVFISHSVIFQGVQFPFCHFPGWAFSAYLINWQSGILGT